MSKHTPGPWRVFAGTGFDYLGIEGENDQTVVIYGLDGDDGGVRGLTKEESKANACLIASAPELYEALKEVIEVLRKEAKGTPLNNHKFDALGAKALKAIAKAEGK